MKSQDNEVLIVLHSGLQIDEVSRRGWAARSALQLAQRLQQLAPDTFTDVGKLTSYLQRRRRPLCWCLLLLGGRVDVQLQAVVELYSQCSEPEEAAYLQTRAAELTQLLQQQQQLLQELQEREQAGLPLEKDGVAVTPGLLLDEGGGGASSGTDGGHGGSADFGGGVSRAWQSLDLMAYCLERLAALLARVRHDPECEEIVSHVVLRRNGAPLACLVRALQPAATATSAGGSPGKVPSSGIHPAAPYALRALSYLSAFNELRVPLLAAGVVPPLLGYLPSPPSQGAPAGSPSQRQQQRSGSPQPTAHSRQRMVADAAQILANLSMLEAAGREILRAPGPAGIQALVALLSGGFGAAAVAPAVHALAALSAHPTLRPGLVAAGATEALTSLVERSGGPLLAAWVPDPGGDGGGSPGSAASDCGGGPGSGAAAAAAAASQWTMELALLTLVRCIRSYGSGSAAATAGGCGGATTGAAGGGGGGGGGGGELPAASLQLLLDVAAMPSRSAPPSVSPSPTRGSPPMVAAAGSRIPQQQNLTWPLLSSRVAGTGSGQQQQQQLPSTSAVAVAEATEALADMAREAPGALRVLSFAGHLVLLQRLLANMPAALAPSPVLRSSSSPSASSLAVPSSTPPSNYLDPLAQRQLDACLRGLARLSMAAPSHPDLRLARTHEALLHVLLAMGLADRPGWWALQGLCALAADARCASDLVAAGVLPPVVAALRGLAAAQPRRHHFHRHGHRSHQPNHHHQHYHPHRSSPGGGGLGAWSSSYSGATGDCGPRGGAGGTPVTVAATTVAAPAAPAAAAAAAVAAAAASQRDVEVAHMLGLLLQNLAGHKALARVAVAAGAVPAICEWLAVCASNDDVEGAVLCCASLCLLGDGEQGALVDMVHSDGLDTLVGLLHPRWATAALVPSTVAAAIAVACRWPASAQAVRMASGIPALADTLRGPHGLACCRPVVSALVDLIANDPPALREIRTTNTVIALGTQLQLLPNNDPRAARIRLLLRQLGEDPDTAMRLAAAEADNAAAAAAAAPHHQHHPLHGYHQHHSHTQNQHSRFGGGGSGAAAGVVPGVARHPNAGALRLQLEAAAAAASGGGGSGSWRWRFARSSESGPDAPPAAAAAAMLMLPAPLRNFRASSPGAIVPAERIVGGGGGTCGGGIIGGGAAAGGSDTAMPAAGLRWRTSREDDLGSVLAALRGESSYKSLRRASLKQLAMRMDASDFSDVEDDVEDYMAVLEVSSRDQGNGSTSLSRAASAARRQPPQVDASLTPVLGISSSLARCGSKSQSLTDPRVGAAVVITATAGVVTTAVTMTAGGGVHSAPPLASAGSPGSGGGGGAAVSWESTVGASGDIGVVAARAAALLSILSPANGDTANGRMAEAQNSGDTAAAVAAVPPPWQRPPSPRPQPDGEVFFSYEDDVGDVGGGAGRSRRCDHRYGSGDSGEGDVDDRPPYSRQHSSSGQVPPSVDFWLEADESVVTAGANGQPPTANGQQQGSPQMDAVAAAHATAARESGGRDGLTRLDNYYTTVKGHENYQNTDYQQNHQYKDQLPQQQHLYLELDGFEPPVLPPLQQQEPLVQNDDQRWQQAPPPPYYHHQQQQEGEEEHRPVGRRGRNAVVNTLQAVNPLRLFGAVRRGSPRRHPQDEDDGGDGGGGTALRSMQSGGGRRSLQVDGDELVFWSAVEADS